MLWLPLEVLSHLWGIDTNDTRQYWCWNMGSRNCNCFHINSYSSSGTDVNLSQVSLHAPLHPDSQSCLAPVVMLSRGVQGRTQEGAWRWVWASSCSSRDLGSVGMWDTLLTSLWGLSLTSHQTHFAALYIIIRPDCMSGHDRPGLSWSGPGLGQVWPSPLLEERRKGVMRVRGKLLEGKNMGQHVHSQERWGVTKGTEAASNGATKD